MSDKPAIRITLDDPRFDQTKPIMVNGVLFIPAKGNPIAGRIDLAPTPKTVVEVRRRNVVKANFS